MSSTQGNVTGRKPGETSSGQSPQSVDFDELLDDKEVAALLKQRPQTLAGWRCDGRGPQFLKVGRRVLYRRVDVQIWLAGQIVRPGEAA